MLPKEHKARFDLAALTDVRPNRTGPLGIQICLTHSSGVQRRLLPTERRPRIVGEKYVTFEVEGRTLFCFWRQQEYQSLIAPSSDLAVELFRVGSCRWWLFRKQVYRNDTSLTAEQITALLIERQETQQRKIDRAVQKLHTRRATRSSKIPAIPHDTGTPAPRFIKTWKVAERVALEWMRHLGYSDAQLTPEGADEGIDIVSASAVAQVKAEMTGKTGRETVQQLYGVAHASTKAGMMFSLAGYTDKALAWGSEHGLALFEFDEQGKIQPLTEPARKLMARPARAEVTRIEIVDAPFSPAAIRGTVGGCPAFCGIVLGVSEYTMHYPRLIIRTARDCSDVLSRPDWDIDWYSNFRLSSWPQLLSPYRRDQAIGSGCSIGLSTDTLKSVVAASRAPSLQEWIPQARGWFYLAGCPRAFKFTADPNK